MVARLPFVDAHVHLWDRGRLRYPWLDAPAQAPIASNYLAADYVIELAAWNCVGFVHVEAGASADDARNETAWLADTAADALMPRRLVAQVSLERPDVAADLEWQAAQPGVVGVRQIVNWLPQDASRRAYPYDLTVDEHWRRGYALLGRHGLSFDFHGFPAQLTGLAEVAAAHPDTRLILNHLALPIVADGLETWRAGLTRLAAMPHVAIKLSGAGFVHRPFDPAMFRDIVAEVIDLFGTGRVMIGTNFPTDRLAADLDTTLGAYEAILTPFAEDERRAMWGRNANLIYRLDLDL